MTRFPVLRTAALAGASALLLAACASETSDEAAVEPPPTLETAAPTDQQHTADATAEPTASGGEESMLEAPVPAELEWAAATVSGGEIAGKDLAGTDAILWVWASWCPVCQAEAPEVAAAFTQLPEGVALYGLAGRSDPEAAEAFVATYGLEGFEHIFDEQASIWATFGVSYQPAFVLINDDGTIDTIPGSLNEEGILDAAEQLAQS
ncbi:TlpA disulfide reductase family protein [Demequina sp. NBRC 110053]|uniref:TlpA family protein disulfide reductase n=1 Tax=Demequina sp. NBRC 110053 TaxID=1570342 RepID=UPI000A0511B0|nr:TlpA disulfide reductase family protein [Demequina sp. NBRC 110053]